MIEQHPVAAWFASRPSERSNRPSPSAEAPVVISSADPSTTAAAAQALAALGFIVRTLGSPLRVGPLVIDAARHDVRCSGERLSLTPTEFRLLVALAERADHVVPPAVLLAEAWGPEYFDSIHSVKPVVSRLRRKLGVCAGGGVLIETVRGFGYRLRSDDG